jgi:hypothetical protein
MHSVADPHHFHAGPDPDPALHFYEDPDPSFRSDADPYPDPFDADPNSGSTTPFLNIWTQNTPK